VVGKTSARQIQDAQENVHSKRLQGGLVMRKFHEFLKNESGATAIEYGLIAAGISVVIIAIVNTLGTQINTKLTGLSDQLQ
jgi:pilus assembly protein Flp/PilA